MIISRVAQRYAEAVFASVPETERSAFMTDVRDMQATLAQSRELTLFFESPVIETEKKLRVIEALCNGHFGDWLHRVLKLLVNKDREDLTAEILEALTNLHRKAQGIHKMNVATAIPLPDAAREELRAGLEGFVKGSVDVDYTTDEALLGGVVVRMGDTVYDGSIQRQLSRLSRKFKTA